MLGTRVLGFESPGRRKRLCQDRALQFNLKKFLKETLQNVSRPRAMSYRGLIKTWDKDLIRHSLKNWKTPNHVLENIRRLTR